MSDTKPNKAQEAIETLLNMHVGRRWVLKLGASLTAAGSLGVLSACSGGSKNGHSNPTPNEPLTVPRTLQFALGQVKGFKALRLAIAGQSIPLTPHTAASRLTLLQQGGVWEKMNMDVLTHYCKVPFPTGKAQIATVYGVRKDQESVLTQAFLIPEPATANVAAATYALTGSYALAAGSPERFAALGLDGAQIASSDEVIQVEQVLDTFQMAETLTMMHPSVATQAPNEAATTRAVLHQTPEVATLGNYIAQMLQNGQPPAQSVAATNASGQPSHITVKGKDKTVTTTFSMNQLNRSDETFIQTAHLAFVAGIHAVRDSADLGAVIDKPLDKSKPNSNTWHQPEGMHITPVPYSSSGVGASVGTTIQNPGSQFGIQVSANGEPSGGTVPLTFYNNYVRWVSVYVQYLQADGTPLSFSPVGRDTQYAKWVGLLQQIYTVLGIPLWDTNTLNATLEFPSDATTARLLFCGLGSELVGNGWRQYFPSTAYPNAIAPSYEVRDAAVMTSIFSLGLTTFSLASDIDIAATWLGIKEFIGADLIDEIKEFISVSQSLFNALENLCLSVIASETTYGDLKDHNASFSDFWRILAPLGAIFTKILFGRSLLSSNKFKTLIKISEAIASLEAVQKTLDAIPLLGEILEVLAVAGDVATLAQAIGETVNSPWVVANQVTRTYPVTVTVSRDPLAATWPVTARSWQIQAKINGMVATRSVIGLFNVNGTDSEPIVLNLSGLFGGATITWSIVILDGNGHQVGAGASATLPNNDANNPPSNVAFAITELPAVITANTVFKRAATTMYNAALNGCYTWASPTPDNGTRNNGCYTWASPTPDNGTRNNAGIQEVINVTVATRLGVAGIVFQQNDKYWLRGVPLVQNGSTMQLGSATRQGYTRRPFLLFDALVGKADIANHVLLEPDDVSDGYYVRALSIDPTTGALSWDSSIALGYFILPVSAAALHASGHVVTVHTDSGRLGRLMPANTPNRPPLAAYTAGPGKQVGLLSSPTALAVSAPGTIIVLEAGISQLAAFDLNGNPVRQFGDGAVKNFTLPLPSSRVYLDIAVDGSGDMYVLFYQGGGSQPNAYGINVYSPTGDPISTLSTGDNVPHLAVDYWRSIYAANYTPLLDNNGQAHVDPNLGVAEPSLSRFDPS